MTALENFPASAPSRANTDSLRPLQHDILRTADQPLDRGQALPAAAFTDPALYAWEMEHLFRQEWIALGHISQLPGVGDYLAVDLAGEPLVAIRGKDGQIRVLSRVRKHRGMDIMPPGFDHQPQGNKRVLLCPYHFWGYELDGQLKGCPEMQKAAGFNRKDVALHEFRSEVWNGFIFVNLSGDAPPLPERFAAVDQKFLARWDMDEAKCVWSRDWPSTFNWKVLVENFMEPYHHMGSHAKSLEPMMPAKGCWTEPLDETHIAVHLPLKDSLIEGSSGGRELCTFRPFPRMEDDDFTQWWVFLLYPNFLIFSAPDRFYWYRVIPTSPSTMQLTTTMFVHPAAMDAPGYEATLAKEIETIVQVHTEDIEACVGIQRGMTSAGWSQGRLSHLEEPIWHIQQYLARKIREAAGNDSFRGEVTT